MTDRLTPLQQAERRLATQEERLARARSDNDRVEAEIAENNRIIAALREELARLEDEA